MISLEWVRDYIDISDQDPESLAVKITKAGINIERVIRNSIDNLVIGKVLECTDHPDSDHLHVCMVDIGKEEAQQIVCGAPNVRKDLKVIVALPGAILPGDFEIKKSKIRGVESNGMICALCEIGLEEKTDENWEKGIHELDDNAPIGQDPISYLGRDDTLYELDIHKHRNNDCYYHIGFAYEIGAILNRRVTLPVDDFTEEKDSIDKHFSLEVQTKKCPFYLAKMVTDVKVGESPEFIKKRLEAAGMRSINNVVDISNYVMLEYGQPLHFFDKDKLGDKIVVRDAHIDEEIKTLDGVDRKLQASDIVITDGEKAVCIAGVMGGENTEVTDTTKNILIESAIFDSVSIRCTAASLDLKSEASVRYGKGLNYEYTEKAINRACHLLEKYAGAKVLSGTVKHDVIEKEEKTVIFSEEEINKLLGIEISKSDMEIELERLEFPYKIKNNKFVVTIPNRRLDIDPNINDIAEEIGRLFGYENLISTLPKLVTKRGEYVGDVSIRKIISKRLRSYGLNEVKTYTLVSKDMFNSFRYEEKDPVILPNPMSSDKEVVRTTLVPSLLNTYNYNKARKVKDIFIYEIAKTYDKDYIEDSKICGLLSGNYLVNDWHGSKKIDFYIVKGIVEDLLDYLGFKNRYTFERLEGNCLHPGVSASILLDREPIGIIGKIHPRLSKDEIYVFELSMNALMKNTKPLKFKEANKYPAIEKDMAFILDKSVLAKDIMTTIRKAGGRILSDITIFDIYEGDRIASDKKSMAFKLKFESFEKTLTDNEVMQVFNNIIEKVIKNHDAILRDK